MPLTIQVFIPAGETTAMLTAITGTGTAANPYTITQQGTSQFGTIEVADAANLLGLWQVKVGTRAIHRVEIVAGTTNYPLLSTQAAAAAAITAAGLATAEAVGNVETIAEVGNENDLVILQRVAEIRAALGTPANGSIAADIAAIEGGGGGAGASAEAIVDEIENRGITTVAVQSGVTNATTLELVQGDTYDGIAKPLLGFGVSKDYTDGWTATLTIRDQDDTVVASHTGTVASASSITFSITAPTGLVMVGCPGSWKGKFDVQLSKSTSRETITRGACYVYEDQTRN